MSNGHRIRLVLSVVETDDTFRKEQVRGALMWVGRCLFCQAKLCVPLGGDADPGVTVEHIVPRHHGGTDDPENLALACAQCNGEKGRRHDNRDRNDARRIEITRALQERRKARWPASARPPRWPSVEGATATQEQPGAAAPPERRCVVSGLYVYPLKSAAGIELTAAQATDRGFEHDRRFMLVDERGRFLSQRSHPSMARLRTSLGPDTLAVEDDRGRSIALPLRPDRGKRVQVSVWDDTCDALEIDGGAWFAEAIGGPCRLVYMPDDTARLVDPSYAERGELVGFADGFPYLIVSKETLDELTERAGEPMVVQRFRPNLLIEGCDAGSEDRWKRVRIGDLCFAMVKPCSRCEITTLDPETGRRGKEPLATLASYRRQKNKVMLGQNAVSEGEGWVRLGDEVEVLDDGSGR